MRIPAEPLEKILTEHGYKRHVLEKGKWKPLTESWHYSSVQEGGLSCKFQKDGNYAHLGLREPSRPPVLLDHNITDKWFTEVLKEFNKTPYPPFYAD